jgi:putative transposase
MPWKETDVKNQRLEFVLRALDKSMSFVELCREYEIKPKTGYKWKDRFLKEGLSGLSDRSRRPRSHKDQLQENVVCEIVRLKRAHPSWGARKIRDVYCRKHTGGEAPSESSFKRVLEKAGLVKKKRRRKSPHSGRLQNALVSECPNEVWTVDFKGYWYTQDGSRCEPLTVQDSYSRYVLCASVPVNAKTNTIREEFERVFVKYGLPQTIRSDNGRPFAAATAPWGLSQLSSWWLALGISLDRIDPGRPSQNGRHERMHRDIAFEVEKRVDGGLAQQAAALETWRQIYNRERPHEAIAMKRPAELYCKSSNLYRGAPEQLDYPQGMAERTVTSSGEIGFGGGRIRISSAIRGWNVGLKPLKSNLFAVYFGSLCLGQVDLHTESFHPHSPSPEPRGQQGA